MCLLCFGAAVGKSSMDDMVRQLKAAEERHFRSEKFALQLQKDKVAAEQTLVRVQESRDSLGAAVEALSQQSESCVNRV